MYSGSADVCREEMFENVRPFPQAAHFYFLRIIVYYKKVVLIDYRNFHALLTS